MNTKSVVKALVVTIVLVVVVANLGMLSGPGAGDGPREVTRKATHRVATKRPLFLPPADLDHDHSDEKFVVGEEKGSDGDHHHQGSKDAVDPLGTFVELGHTVGKIPALNSNHVLQEIKPDTYSMAKGHQLLWYNKTRPSREAHRDRILRAIHVLGTFLDAVEIEYFIAYGTLLGSWREGGFIEHDHDGDLVIKASDIDRLKQAIADWVWPDDDFQIIFRVGQHWPMIFAKFADKTTGLYIDVWLIWEASARDEDLENTYLLPIVANGPGIRNGLGGFKRSIPLRPEQVFPLQRCLFEGWPTWCPADTHYLLHAMYYNPSVPKID